MKVAYLISILLCLVSSVASADIKSLYDDEESKVGQKQHLAELRTQIGEKMAQKHFVYVAGFLNEILPFQFIKNEEALRVLGAKAVTQIYPSSKTSILASAEEITAKLFRLYFNGNEKGEGQGLPIVLIGHSKGGAEVVLTVINNPALIAGGFVDRVVAVQAGFETPLSELAPLGQKLCKSSISPCKFIEALFKDGLESLRSSISQEVFGNALDRLQQIGLYAEVSKSIFYVRSTQTVREGLAPAIVASHIYLNKYGANDGVVLVKNQHLESIGNDLGVMDADHADLFIHKNVLVYGEFLRDSTRAQRIKSFTRALMRSLYLNN